jgi:hypothetical protein
LGSDVILVQFGFGFSIEFGVSLIRFVSVGYTGLFWIQFRYLTIGRFIAGLVPMEVVGEARTSWEVGMLPRLNFWTRLNTCPIYFLPGGDSAELDRILCRSWPL